MAVDLSIHTMVLHHQISHREAVYICKKYNIPFFKDVNIDYSKIKVAGVDNVSIKTIQYYKNGIKKFKYEMSIRINVGRLIKDSRHLMLIWSKKNAERVYKRMSEVFQRIFMIGDRNGDPYEWYVKRIDCGMDIRVPDDAILSVGKYIDYLHNLAGYHSDNGYHYYKFAGYDTEEKRHESLCIESDKGDHRYNIYDKHKALVNECNAGKVITPEELSEVDRILRIEDQIFDFNRMHRGKKTFQVLMNESITEKMVEKILNELKILFPENVGSLMFYTMLNQCNDGRGYGFTDLIEMNLSTRIKRRNKARFGKPTLIKENNRSPRYKANITLHKMTGETYRTAVVGSANGTYAECERKILNRIKTNTDNNLVSAISAEEKISVLQMQIIELELFMDTIPIDEHELRRDVIATIRAAQYQVAKTSR